jgi:hypothetical protein
MHPDGAKVPEDRVVFQIIRDSECSECGTELERGSMLSMEPGHPLCLACAGLGDLEFLAAGDSALTRRAAQGSQRKAVVVRYSRARSRYERQGILVEAAALEKAERACELDAEERAVARSRAAVDRVRQDRALVRRIVGRLLELFPRCPPEEARAIAEHTATRGSGRIGRTADMRNLEDRPLRLAVVAAIRHRHTNYDELLARGHDRESARRQTADLVEEFISVWQGKGAAAS